MDPRGFDGRLCGTGDPGDGVAAGVGVDVGVDVDVGAGDANVDPSLVVVAVVRTSSSRDVVVAPADALVVAVLGCPIGFGCFPLTLTFCLSASCWSF